MLTVLEWFLMIIGGIAVLWAMSIAVLAAYIVWKFLREGDG